MKKLLVVIDYQNDFVSGALGFEGATLLEAPLLQAVEETLSGGGWVLFTRDTHDTDYLDTREGKLIPIPHCIRGTAGHALYGGLHRYEAEPTGRVAILDKPTFGAANIAQAVLALCGSAPDSIEIGGVVTDICVITNALLLHSAFLDADIKVTPTLCGSGNAQGAAMARGILQGMGLWGS